MKNNIKKLFIFLTLFLLVISITMVVVNGMNSQTALSGSDYENPTDNSEASELMASWLGAALVVVQVVGVGVAVIMLVVLAIKYIAAAPSDKAESSKSNKRCTRRKCFWKCCRWKKCGIIKFS